MDMLVKLYNLPEFSTHILELKKMGIEIRQAWPSEKRVIGSWVRDQFNDTWANEAEASLGQRPTTCYIATQKDPDHEPTYPYDLPFETLLGFSCYDAIYKGMYGPVGVREDFRGYGIGKALLLATLQAMSLNRYAYAVIGWVGPIDFYTQTVNAIPIEGTEPGFFRGPLIP